MLELERIVGTREEGRIELDKALEMETRERRVAISSVQVSRSSFLRRKLWAAGVGRDGGVWKVERWWSWKSGETVDGGITN
jgi:hypothetical protein